MNGPEACEYLFFDLDGTLTDPSEGITSGVSHALSRFGITVEDRSSLLAFIGPPLRESFMRFYGFGRDDAQKAIAFFQEYYAPVGVLQNVPYPGIRELLADLKASGRKLVLATSKPEVFARQILERFGMAESFAFIAGGDVEETRVDKAEVIAFAMDGLGITRRPPDAFMVGDRSYDVVGAARHGIPTIGVGYGFGSRSELEQAGAAAFASDVGELRRMLEGLRPAC